MKKEKDPLENKGALASRAAAPKTSRVEGHGNSMAKSPAPTSFHECVGAVTAGANPVDTKSAIKDGSSRFQIVAMGLTFTLIRIEPGRFLMGSPEEETGHHPNEQLRAVRVTKAFYIGQFAVTQQQFNKVMGVETPSACSDSPAADGIPYLQAIQFCRELSSQAGTTVNLPTEAQWEYACRANTRGAYSDGNSEVDLSRSGWYRENSDGHVHHGGEKQPNAWGLYDMLGNVGEMCSDFIRRSDEVPGADPFGATTGNFGAIRGGSWSEGPERCRCACRSISNDILGRAGFRIAICC